MNIKKMITKITAGALCMLMFAATVGQTISSVHAAQSDVIDTSRTGILNNPQIRHDSSTERRS